MSSADGTTGEGRDAGTTGSGGAAESPRLKVVALGTYNDHDHDDHDVHSSAR